MNEFIITYYFSIIFQFISLFIQGYGYNLYVNPSLTYLKYALNIEFFVSLIEILIYIWIGTNLLNYNSVMKKRYLDWVITTNSLMLSFSFLFLFFNDKKINEMDINEYTYNNKINDSIINYIFNNFDKYLPIIIFNNLMLLCGYLGETNLISKKYSFTIGFLFFFISFYYLYEYFAKYSFNGSVVLYGLSFIWSLYGISHILNDKWKNVCYNILDLISKNIFGIILVIMLIYYNNSEI